MVWMPLLVHISTVKPDSQYDARTSIAYKRRGDTGIDLISISALCCKRPTNQIVEKFNVRSTI